MTQDGDRFVRERHASPRDSAVPRVRGTDRRESKPGNVILTSRGCGYRAEFEATALRANRSNEEH